MHAVAKLITADQDPKIVVLSALSGTTNALVEIGQSLSEGKRTRRSSRSTSWRRITALSAMSW
ncbi:hypothetical protein [Chitinophaga sedimenti]|uniref:hypothetical protein n=1 Tax=Chitinophaga sedimenti TaxID=2033606 RepID=UPI00249DE15A|nr:hypothetical protein [Chitinophaga sedimenti]